MITLNLPYISLEYIETFFFFLKKDSKGRFPFGNLISASEIKEQWM